VADTDVVPPFATGPLVTWGPEPAGTPHPEPPPHGYDLLHQSVHVRFDWARHAVIGTTTIRVAALDTALRVVTLNAVGMHIGRVAAAGGRALRHEYNDSILTIHLRRPLPPHAATEITVAYEGDHRTRGAYFIDRVHYLWTQGETDENRYWIPTWDAPNDKTTWDINVLTAPGEKALSNGRLVSVKHVRGGTLWSWAQDKPASTYLMSVVTGKYTVLHDSAAHVPIEYWVYPDSVAAGWRGFASTPRAIRVYEARTGVKYPWAKYAQSVAPDFEYGGMENVSATTQIDNGILHPAWAEPERDASGLVAHELGHQWYGDLLTTAWWPHVWLNEGFATFMEQIFQEADKGVDVAGFDRYGAQLQTMDADRRARRPIVYDRWQKDPIEVFFSGHIYPKGATVLQMLRHQLGDSLFWAAMHRYTVDNAYRNVVTADLERAFEQTTGRSFRTFFNQWVYGAGFPVFQVSTAYDSAARRLTISAREVQPRDSLTGFFDADVDVKVLTDGGAVRGVVPVHDSAGSTTLTLPAPPRAVLWNYGHWVLALSDFPRSTTMLAYQLEHDDDAIGRWQAIEHLAARPGEALAARSVAAAATGDAFYGVRARAATALAAFADKGTRPIAAAALDRAAADPDPRVREVAVVALASFPGGATPELLASVAQHDHSLIVRGLALAAYLRVAGDAALPLATTVMAQPSWLDALRRPALAVLKEMPGAAANALYTRYAPPPPAGAGH